MTLGKKLSNYRKMLGWTQQQLGEHLNLSAQAVSKWENDLAEPDLITLKALAKLYSVTVDDILNNDNENFQSKASKSESHAEEEQERAATIGFCKNCGIVVTEENIGERSPVVLCNDCYVAKNLKHKKQLEEAELERKRRLDDIDRLQKASSNEMKRKVRISSIVAGIVAIAFLVIWIVSSASSISFGNVLAGVILSCFIFTFVSLLFYDTAVLDVLEYMGTASINWPGVIFTFDIDGFIFLIAIKALFAVLGFLFGLVCAVIGVFVSIFISIFIYPFVMFEMVRCIKKGEHCAKYLF